MADCYNPLCIHTHTHTYTHKHTHAHTHTHKHTHKHTRTHIHTHAHKHTHTHVQTQEHYYHVLEKDIASYGAKVIPPDPDAPELPSPFKPGSPSPDPPPIYHDITEISSADECIDCNKTDQNCLQDLPDLITDGSSMTCSKLQKEKVQLST